MTFASCSLQHQNGKEGRSIGGGGGGGDRGGDSHDEKRVKSFPLDASEVDVLVTDPRRAVAAEPLPAKRPPLDDDAVDGNVAPTAILANDQQTRQDAETTPASKVPHPNVVLL